MLPEFCIYNKSTSNGLSMFGIEVQLKDMRGSLEKTSCLIMDFYITIFRSPCISCQLVFATFGKRALYDVIDCMDGKYF